MDKEEFIFLNFKNDNYFEENSYFLENFKIENWRKGDKEKIEIEIDNIINKKIEIKIAENKTPYHNILNNNNNKLLFLIEKTKRRRKLNMNNTNELIINNKKNNIREENNLVNNFYKESTKSNKFICHNIQKDKIYRKDYYYKHFKAIFGKYVKNKINDLKNKCFPNLIFNNFSTPSYYFIGNPKEIDNFNFLSWSIKEIMIYKENVKKINRQHNNRLLIDYINKSGEKTKDKKAYTELIAYINNKLENAFLDFYENQNEFDKICKDENCIFFDNFFKKETGYSLLEKYGFLKVIQKNYQK